MHRLRFSKTGDAIYLSHLDLMRVMQRAFSRAGIMLKHSGGYSPRPYVAAALPLSVGVESECELLDYELPEGVLPPDDLAQKLNATMPQGIRILEAYDSDRKTREIALLQARLTLEYDARIPRAAIGAVTELLSGQTLIVPKHTKRGEAETDIRPMLHTFTAEALSPQELALCVTVSAQEPSLNPLLLLTAIERYLPQYKPDFAVCRRLGIFDKDGKPFR